MEEDILNDFYKAWQTLDAELITKHLDETFIYDSMWVFSSLDYQGYKDYIYGKFQTLKKHGITIEAEIVKDPYFGGKMIKLLQQGNRPCFYRIKIVNHKVVKVDLSGF